MVSFYIFKLSKQSLAPLYRHNKIDRTTSDVHFIVEKKHKDKLRDIFKSVFRVDSKIKEFMKNNKRKRAADA